MHEQRNFCAWANEVRSLSSHDSIWALFRFGLLIALPKASMGHHRVQFIVLTGGPGAGKTAVLEVLRHHLCQHVGLLPEAASIIFGGGFPRGEAPAKRRAGQRAIYRVQYELERLATEEQEHSVIVCDRGTLDGLAYWPDSPEDFFRDNETTVSRELSRYSAVIHLQTPPSHGGYNHQNPLRTETAEQAAAIDLRIADAWAAHPRRIFIPNERLFINKIYHVAEALTSLVPACCPASHSLLGTLKHAS